MHKYFYEYGLNSIECLNLRQVHILWYILSFQTNNKQCVSSIEKLMEITKTGDKHTTISDIKKLEEIGLIEKDKRYNKSTIYSVNMSLLEEKINSVETNTTNGVETNTTNTFNSVETNTANGVEINTTNGVETNTLHKELHKEFHEKELNKKKNSSMGVTPQATEGFPHKPTANVNNDITQITDEDNIRYQALLRKSKQTINS